MGGRRLLVLFLVSALLSGYGQYWVEGVYFGGLSGVVYALVGYLWMIGVRAPQLNLSIPNPILGFMLIWLVLGFVQPFLAIANTAHLVGLMSGVLLGIGIHWIRLHTSLYILLYPSIDLRWVCRT